MKALIVLILIAGALRVPAATPDSLTTTDGTAYNHITSLRADPDGLYIEYTPRGNGLGCAKVKFTRLSVDLQKQYGYDANAAKQYEADSYKATLAYQTWADQQDAARQKARADAAALQLQEEAILAPKFVVAPQPPAEPAGDYSMPGYLGGYGYGHYGNPARRNAWTGSTFTGSLPEGMLFTPLGYQPTKLQAVPATPRGRSSAHLFDQR